MLVETPLYDYRQYPLHASGSAFARAREDDVWRIVSEIGGDNRYYAMNGLWAIREWLDSAMGGPGRRRGRPVGRPIKTGDRIDSWQVRIADAPVLLALEFGMKAPGQGVLEFRITPMASGAQLTATAFWEPKGIAGQLYWVAMMPAHLVLFKRLTTEICRRAECLT
ncbi:MULTISPECIES: DUF2867 domain-containing protein [unclassified Halomonas]|uniref:DUF2867 domain-containing protein n=1 Tax=unclassified Halomonas TaxID=2609666 RepID=UPI0009903A19|nr:MULTISPECIES: DUF2867 domain-containing protein [unclassified Halomonas]AQU81770.1 hypothetical protein B2G49_03620 [Halomonas sp. 'Soap Lake \